MRAQGNVVLVGRKSPYSLYNQTLSSFEDDGGAYDQADAAGFIKLQVQMATSISMSLAEHTLHVHVVAFPAARCHDVTARDAAVYYQNVVEP